MYFVVIGRDGTDEGAAERRAVMREAHLAVLMENQAAGKMIMGSALLDDGGAMIGSVMTFNVADRSELDAILAEEPYINGNVWDSVEINECKIPDIFIS